MGEALGECSERISDVISLRELQIRFVESVNSIYRMHKMRKIETNKLE